MSKKVPRPSKKRRRFGKLATMLCTHAWRRLAIRRRQRREAEGSRAK
jgi:hypothetical protein